jgi:hypothetical protein
MHAPVDWQIPVLVLHKLFDHLGDTGDALRKPEAGGVATRAIVVIESKVSIVKPRHLAQAAPLQVRERELPAVDFNGSAGQIVR